MLDVMERAARLCRRISVPPSKEGLASSYDDKVYCDAIEDYVINLRLGLLRVIVFFSLNLIYLLAASSRKKS